MIHENVKTFAILDTITLFSVNKTWSKENPLLFITWEGHESTFHEEPKLQRNRNYKTLVLFTCHFLVSSEIFSHSFIHGPRSDSSALYSEAFIEGICPSSQKKKQFQN